MILSDFSLGRFEAGTLTVAMVPQINITGWSIQFLMSRRFDGETGPSGALVTKSMASGYTTGQSGITMVNAAQGTFNVSMIPTDVSGLDYGIYAYRTARTDSGIQTVLTAGYRQLTPP